MDKGKRIYRRIFVSFGFSVQHDSSVELDTF